MEKIILLTNDDGPESIGLEAAYNAIKNLGRVEVIVPEHQRSATGKALTLDRPLRLRKIRWNNISIWVHDGKPADSIIFATHLFGIENIRLVVSGINSGANVSYQSMFTSGTVGAAMEAAMLSIPAIALSMEVKPEFWFTNNKPPNNLDKIIEISSEIVRNVLENGLPDCDFLNVNFPEIVDENTQIKYTKPAMTRIFNSMMECTDPHGVKCYWISGEQIKTNKGEDAYVLTVEQNITISKIKINMV